LEGDYAAARLAVEKAMAADSTLIDVHWESVAVALAEEKFDEVLQRLIDIDKQFSPEWDDLAKNEDYAAFVKSSQYQDWLQYLKSR
jgi:hypothetical protein